MHAHDAVFSGFGVGVASRDYWNLAPYAGAIYLWEEYWGHLGVGCWKRSKDFLMELSMDMST